MGAYPSPGKDDAAHHLVERAGEGNKTYHLSKLSQNCGSVDRVNSNVQNLSRQMKVIKLQTKFSGFIGSLAGLGLSFSGRPPRRAEHTPALSLLK